VFRNAVRYLRGVDTELNCPLAMTRPYVVALNGAWESMGQPATIAPEYVTREPRDGGTFTGINGISDLLDECYTTGKSYSDLGAPWAVSTPWVEVSDYREFTGNFA
jgi:hypothetical protein